MKKIGVFILITVLLLSLIGFGCSPTAPATQGTTPAQTSTGAQAPDSIKIGVILSVTGFDAVNGKPAQNGCELAAEQINAAGGVMVKEYNKKLPIELVILDMESSPEKAIARSEAVNAQGIPVAIGMEMIIAAPDIYEKNKLPIVNNATTLNESFERGYKYWFSVDKLDSEISQSIVEVFDDLGANKPTKFATMEEELFFTTELKNFLIEYGKPKGMTVVYEGKYAAMSPDLSPLLREAKNAGAEVLFGGPSAPDAITVMKQLGEVGFNPKGIVMIRGADDPAWGQLGPMGDHILGATAWHPSLNYPGVPELNAAYKAKFGEDIHPLSGPAYACVKVIADAIERAGSLDREKIRDAIASTDLMTIHGRIRFDDKGRRLDAPHTVIQWQNGVMELVWPKDSRTKELVYPR